MHRPDGMRCNADQSVSVPVTTTFIWGNASLSGGATTTVDAAGCDYDAGTTWSDNFTLTKA